MNRVQMIYEHPLFQEHFYNLQEAEKDRIFCRHTMEHFLDVARLMYIYNLEDRKGLSKELIYVAAILHDIGRYLQITENTPHDEAGAQLSRIIMSDCGFSEEEIEIIADAISGHRDQNTLSSSSDLAAYLYRADKKSRNCFVCSASDQCKWPDTKKNMSIQD